MPGPKAKMAFKAFKKPFETPQGFLIFSRGIERDLTLLDQASCLDQRQKMVKIVFRGYGIRLFAWNGLNGKLNTNDMGFISALSTF